MFFYFLISSALAQPVSNATFGFTPTHAECTNIKNQLCSIDPTCVSLDAAIMHTMMNYPGMEAFGGQMPAGFVGVPGLFPPATLGTTLAQFAFMVTYSVTGGYPQCFHSTFYGAHKLKNRKRFFVLYISNYSHYFTYTP